MTILCKQGFCDLGRDDPRTSWDEDGCKQFVEKHKQVIGGGMIPYCLKVCGNCEFFTVGEVGIPEIKAVASEFLPVEA